MEKVRINEKLYDLVANGVQLAEQGGKIIFQPGAANFAVVEADVQATKAITVLDEAGEPILTRSDLVYAGRLAKDDNYVIGTEQVQTGTDSETGDPIMDTRDVTGTVMIAEFRIPDLREQLAATEAKLEYVGHDVWNRDGGVIYEQKLWQSKMAFMWQGFGRSVWYATR